MTISEEWAALSETMYGEPFIAELADWLARRGVRTVLECGCGGGHILEGLARYGFTGLGIDADLEMIAIAKVRHPHPAIEFRQLNWLKIDWLEEMYDAVISRGNSLAYTAGWPVPTPDANPRQLIEQSLASMFDKIKPGGLLYVDTISQSELEQGDHLAEIVLPCIRLTGQIEYSQGQMTRTIYGSGTVHGDPFAGKSVCYLLSPDELQRMMAKLKPAKIIKPQLATETNYHAICAVKTKRLRRRTDGSERTIRSPKGENLRGFLYS